MHLRHASAIARKLMPLAGMGEGGQGCEFGCLAEQQALQA